MTLNRELLLHGAIEAEQSKEAFVLVFITVLCCVLLLTVIIIFCIISSNSGDCEHVVSARLTATEPVWDHWGSGVSAVGACPDF